MKFYSQVLAMLIFCTSVFLIKEKHQYTLYISNLLVNLKIDITI